MKFLKKPSILLPVLYSIALLVAYVGSTTSLDSCTPTFSVICFGPFTGIGILLMILPTHWAWGLFKFTGNNATPLENSVVIVANIGMMVLIGLTIEFIIKNFTRTKVKKN